VKSHIWRLRKIHKFLGKPLTQATNEDLRDFLYYASQKYSTEGYNSFIKSIRRFFRDFLRKPLANFKFKPTIPKPKKLPTKKQLREFYYAIPHETVQRMFLLFCVSGLRRSEVLGLTQDQIDFANRMIMPKHYTRTKRAFITFYNEEVELPKIKKTFPISRCKTFQPVWRRAKETTGLNITPNVLRHCFSGEKFVLS
jgi:integrase